MKKPSPISLAAQIDRAIDFHAAPVVSTRSGRIESGTPDTLAKRLALPDAEHVSALIQSGRLRSFGPVHRKEPQGPHRFSTDDLNDIKREVLAGIAERIIEEYDGDAKHLSSAVSAALADYLKSLKDGTAAKGFARVAPARTRSFAYAYPHEERPGLLRRVATGAAVAGAAYGGLSYLRGRAAGSRGLLPALKGGHVANIANIRKAGSRVLGLLRPRPSV